MMKYILLVYRDEKWWAALSARERAALEESCQTIEQDLVHSLHLIDVWDLQNDTALTVRIVDGKLSVSDRPAAENQEQLTQLVFIEARDLNAAIQIASQMPQAQGGAIEVRAIVE